MDDSPICHQAPVDDDGGWDRARYGPIRLNYSLPMGDVVVFRRQSSGLLWRQAVGEQLRQERAECDDRLVDVAERAGVSTQYLSELERGLKEPSSEVLAGLAHAFELSVAELTSRASIRLAIRPSRLRGPVCLAA